MIEDIYIFFVVCVLLNILFIYIFRVSPVVIKYVKLYKVKIKNNSNSGSKWSLMTGKVRQDFFSITLKGKEVCLSWIFFYKFPIVFFISYYYQKHMILSSYSKIITSWKMNISESLKKLKFYTVRASFSILKRRAELSVNSIAIGFCLRWINPTLTQSISLYLLRWC